MAVALLGSTGDGVVRAEETAGGWRVDCVLGVHAAPGVAPVPRRHAAGASRCGSNGSDRLRVAFRRIQAVAYDEELAGRIRALVEDEPGVSEQRMFGGLAFLVGGNMAVAASGQGGILVRVDPAGSDELVASTSAYPMEMRGRQMSGWLRVDADDVRDERALAEWVERGTAFARSLPAKR